MSTSANRGLAVIGGAIVVIGIIVASLASSWTVPERDPKSPEGVVQAYLAAVLEHDSAAALALLESQTACTVEQFDQSYVDRDVTINLVDVEQSGDDATVQVSIEHSNGDPFGGTWNEEQYLRLVKSDGAWRLSGSPWPVYNCEMVVKS